jgi:hypothetical protein
VRFTRANPAFRHYLALMRIGRLSPCWQQLSQGPLVRKATLGPRGMLTSAVTASPSNVLLEFLQAVGVPGSNINWTLEVMQ